MCILISYHSRYSVLTQMVLWNSESARDTTRTRELFQERDSEAIEIETEM